MEVHPEAKEDEEDNDVPDLIHRRRVSTEGFLMILDINQLAPEAVIQEQSPWVAAVVTSTIDGRINAPPADDLSAHFQAHDAVLALANLNSAEVFVDIQNDSLISLVTRKRATLLVILARRALCWLGAYFATPNRGWHKPWAGNGRGRL